MVFLRNGPGTPRNPRGQRGLLIVSRLALEMATGTGKTKETPGSSQHALVATQHAEERTSSSIYTHLYQQLMLRHITLGTLDTRPRARRQFTGRLGVDRMRPQSQTVSQLRYRRLG